MTRPKRVLLISYNYPPVSAGGALRAEKLARYLPEHGWIPTVLTVRSDRTQWGKTGSGRRRPPAVKVIRAAFPDLLTLARDLAVRLKLVRPSGPEGEFRPYHESTEAAGAREALTRSLVNWSKRWASFPDRYLLWFPFAFARGLAELRAGRYDAILSTSPPQTCHLVAAALHRATGLPWLADMQDPWTQNLFVEHHEARRRVEERLELAVMAGASGIVAVSPPMAADTESFHGRRPAGILSVTNGYDPADYPEGIEPLTGVFTVTFTGVLYGLLRDPGPFLRLVDGLMTSGELAPGSVLVRFYGPVDPALEEARAGLAHPEIVEINGIVSREEALDRQSESAALLLLMGPEPYNAEIYPGGKFFEYLGTGRPVFAWAPAGGIICDLVARTGAGYCATDPDKAGKKLLEWIREFETAGEVTIKPVQEQVASYSWPSLAGRFARALDVTVVSGQAHY